MGFWDGSGISWTIRKQSALRCKWIITPATHHSIFAGRMHFLTPNQQCQSTEGMSRSKQKLALPWSLQCLLIVLVEVSCEVWPIRSKPFADLASTGSSSRPTSCWFVLTNSLTPTLTWIPANGKVGHHLNCVKQPSVFARCVSYQATEPGFSFFLVFICVVVHFFWLANACCCCVRFSFFHMKQRKTTTQSINPRYV